MGCLQLVSDQTNVCLLQGWNDGRGGGVREWKEGKGEVYTVECRGRPRVVQRCEGREWRDVK